MESKEAVELLENQGQNVEEALRIAKTSELLARSAICLLEKIKGGISTATEILKRQGPEGPQL